MESSKKLESNGLDTEEINATQRNELIVPGKKCIIFLKVKAYPNASN